MTVFVISFVTKMQNNDKSAVTPTILAQRYLHKFFFGKHALQIPLDITYVLYV